MKKYVLIFVKTNYSKTPYDQWLSNSGIEPLIIVSDEFAEGYLHLKHVYSFKNYDTNLKVQQKALELIQTYNVIAIFARAEADILRASQLREIAGIQGQHTKSALAYRNKVVMKNYLQQGSGNKKRSLSLPNYKLINSAYDIILFIEKHGYPVVIKPTMESGSFGTNVIKNKNDLDSFLEKGTLINMEIETFVEGQMYHVDGLIKNGEVIFIQPSQYVNDCLSFREDRYVGSVTVSPKSSVYMPLVTATNDILESLPKSHNMAFHCELWIQNDGKIIFCEIASRTGGAGISSVLEKTFGINIDKEWFLAECGIQSHQPILKNSLSSLTHKYQPGGGVWIPPQKGMLKYFPTENLPLSIIESQINGSVGKVYNGGVKSGLYLAGYVLTGESEEAIIQNIHKAADWFNSHSIWENVEAHK